MDKKTIVLTLYGTGNAINDFTITLLDEGSHNYGKSTVQDYCFNINELELKDDKWIYATIVEENQKIKFEKPGRYTDFDILGTLDNRSIQKVLREVDSTELGMALKSAKKETFKAILRNMSKRAARMLVENMGYMGPVFIRDVKQAQRKIVDIIRHLEDTGEIIIPKFGQDVV